LGRAATEAGDLAADTTLEPDAVCMLASVLALAIGPTWQNACLSPLERATVAELYGHVAVALLARLKAQGYFRNADNAKALMSDPDLDALRDRPDFKRLLVPE
jgi:hypothetical protein